MDELVGDAAEQRPGAPEAAGADDDLVRLAGRGHAGDRVGGTVGDDLGLPVDALEVLIQRLDARLRAVEHGVEEELVVRRADPLVRQGVGVDDVDLPVVARLLGGPCESGA